MLRKIIGTILMLPALAFMLILFYAMFKDPVGQLLLIIGFICITAFIGSLLLVGGK